MITVAKSFDTSIEFVFPQDLIENGPIAAKKFAIFGPGKFTNDIFYIFGWFAFFFQMKLSFPVHL